MEEGLTDEELVRFDLLYKKDIIKADREKLKQACRGLLASLLNLLQRMQQWTEKEQTQAEVRVFILDRLSELLPNPPYTPDKTAAIAGRVHDYVWQRSAGGQPMEASPAA